MIETHTITSNGHWNSKNQIVEMLFVILAIIKSDDKWHILKSNASINTGRKNWMFEILDFNYQLYLH